jgi:hypothetical protein
MMNVTNADELRERWPDDDSGARCLGLIVGFLTERLIQTAAGNDCNAVSAQGESAADKVFAALIKDFRSVQNRSEKPEYKPVIKPLNRHVETNPAK